MPEATVSRWRRLRAGAEGTVHVLDQALADPLAARRQAQAASFAVDSPFYPGLRAPVPLGLEREICALAGDALRQAGDSRQPRVDRAAFALVCRPPAELSPPQRLPHYDGTADNLYACILYLAAHPIGGTAFFRQCRTGYEAIGADREQAYLGALRRDLDTFGTPPQGYFAGFPGVFETTATFEGRYNRMLLYPGNLLHSGVIDNAAPPLASVQGGRLTITCFLTLH